MKMHVGEFALLTGVSVRTLHYYDQIGLLKPCGVDSQSGYRFYGSAELEMMEQILFYKELDFPLKDIQKIISSPSYNKKEALDGQKQLLLLKKQRLEKIIEAIERVQEDGGMDIKAFDNSTVEKYKQEVKSRYGQTAAYKEHKEKTAGYTNQKWDEVAQGLNQIIKRFAKANAAGCGADIKDALTLVKELQDYITATQYTCTDEILGSLGEMYVRDERFKRNIDKAGAGTAHYINRAIKAYLQNVKS